MKILLGIVLVILVCAQVAAWKDNKKDERFL